MFALETGVCCSCVVYILGATASALASAARNAPSPVFKKITFTTICVRGWACLRYREGRVFQVVVYIKGANAHSACITHRRLKRGIQGAYFRTGRVCVRRYGGFDV